MLLDDGQWEPLEPRLVDVEQHGKGHGAQQAKAGESRKKAEGESRGAGYLRCGRGVRPQDGHGEEAEEGLDHKFGESLCK